MIPSNPVPQVCNYGTSATYRDLPNEEQLRNGVVPLDSLPAAWWNCMWNMTNGAINCARYAAGVLIDEVNTVLAQAGVCVNCGCVDQLYQAINKIRQTIGTAAVAGAVKSSSTASEVAIDSATGIMSVNCLGNAASLTTTASTVVGAINELKSTYDTCWSNNTTALSGKAPTNHASSANTYGVGTASNYGHLKISDTYTGVLSACSGVAASQCALACVYAVASAAAAGNISLGNTNGCALGTASAGTANTAARSDHVHPTQSYIPYTGAGNGVVTVNQQSTAWCGSAAGWASYLVFNHGDGTSYYNQIIRMPFDGVPQYQRKVSGTNSGWKTFITSENISTQSVNYATSAGSATNACCAGRNGSGTAFGTAATVNTGTAADCIPLIGTALGTTNNNIVVTDTAGKLKPSGTVLGTAAGCAATAFRSNTWYPDTISCGLVLCADKANCAGRVFLSSSACVKWCVTCSLGSGYGCVRLYARSVDSTSREVLIFPECFCIQNGANASEINYPPAYAVCLTTTWTGVGPTYTTCLNCIHPSCGTCCIQNTVRVY